jgi:CBS domain-containing protein
MNAVYDAMTFSPVTVKPTASIGTLLTLFDRYDFNVFPVVGENNRLVGIVSKFDALKLLLDRAAATRPAIDAVASIPLAEVMHRKAIFVEPREALSAAGNLMVVSKLRSLPVIERQGGHPQLVGMLSRGDVLRWLRSELIEGSHVRQEKAS